ncbi:MAG: hypothetical protein ACJ74O_07900 [Frankiaceae bacterium]
MAVVGILLALCAAAYLADVAVTNSLDSQLSMFGSTLTGLTNGRVALIGAAAGFVLALGVAMAVAGLSRRARRRRQHQAALSRQRAETERLAAELERERSARRAELGDDTAVVYPDHGARAADDPLRQGG